MATLDRAGLDRLRRERLTPRALAGAQAAAVVLKEKLSGPGHGRQYPNLPSRSSRPDEYPAEQTSALHDSIGARPAGVGRAEFGPIVNPPPYVQALHFREDGRPFMDDALADRDIREAALRGLKEG